MTEDLALLQEVGIYRYRHPLTDAVAYEKVRGVSSSTRLRWK